MSAPTPIPQADAAIIAQTLNLLFTPDDLIELRALSLRGRNRTDAGYFDSDEFFNRDASLEIDRLVIEIEKIRAEGKR